MEIGTKVFVNELPKNSHPHSTGSEHELINCYGTVTSYVGDGYYTITAEDNTTSGIFRRYDLIYFGSNWPSYRVGEVVRVCDMSEEEKKIIELVGTARWRNTSAKHYVLPNIAGDITRTS